MSGAGETGRGRGLGAVHALVLVGSSAAVMSGIVLLANGSAAGPAGIAGGGLSLLAGLFVSAKILRGPSSTAGRERAAPPGSEAGTDTHAAMGDER